MSQQTAKYFMLSRKTDSGQTVYVTGHRRSREAYSGFEVTTDASQRKALLFGSEKSANDRAKMLSSDFGVFSVEPYTPTATIGDMVDDSEESKVALAEKA